jgi:hypothetical protein
VVLATVVLPVLALYFYGHMVARREERRMDALAATLTAEVKPGMTAVKAGEVLAGLGLEHSAVIAVPDESPQAALSSDKSVICAIIRRRDLATFPVITRAIVIRVYLDEERIVTRTVFRDVFTGP